MSIEVYESRPKNRFVRWYPILITVIAVIFIALWGSSQYHRMKERESFYQQFYAQLSETEQSIAAFLNESGSDQLLNLTTRFAMLDTTMQNARRFVDTDIYYQYTLGNFDQIGKIVAQGLIYNDREICKGFLEDGVISQTERAYLTVLQQDVKALADSLTKNGRVQTNLSVRKLNEKTHVFLSKYANVTALPLKN